MNWIEKRDAAADKWVGTECPYSGDHKPKAQIFKAGADWGKIAGVKEEWEEIRQWKPYLHWCADWDFLLIDKGDAEFEYCTCFKGIK